MPPEQVPPIPSLEELSEMEPSEAVGCVAECVDAYFDAEDRPAMTRLLRELDDLPTDDWPDPFRASLEYTLANTWTDLRNRRRVEGLADWEWNPLELENALVGFRRAIDLADPEDVNPAWLAQAHTNLGNTLARIGRQVEAVECWDRALEIVPGFPMARGLRGLTLTDYGALIGDPGHQAVLFHEARLDLEAALDSGRDLHPKAAEQFEDYLGRLRGILPDEDVPSLDSYDLGSTEDEIAYRRWCLENRMFLHALNDACRESIAAYDGLVLTSVTSPDQRGLHWHAFYNQLKQEFVSARYHLYLGLTETDPHFSDRDVRMFNPLDYPTYSLASERLRGAYRSFYSLFDKVAFFLNDYLGLGVPEKQVSFRDIWFTNREGRKALKADIAERKNWPLRGLLWLSKDLYEKRSGGQEGLLPDARELAELRHHLEHKFLRLHDSLGWSTVQARSFPETLDGEPLGRSLVYPEFKGKTMRVAKMARAALMYLPLAVRVEEARKHEEGDSKTAMPMYMDEWEDEWKQPMN